MGSGSCTPRPPAVCPSRSPVLRLQFHRHQTALCLQSRQLPTDFPRVLPATRPPGASKMPKPLWCWPRPGLRVHPPHLSGLRVALPHARLRLLRLFLIVLSSLGSECHGEKISLCLVHGTVDVTLDTRNVFITRPTRCPNPSLCQSHSPRRASVGSVPSLSLSRAWPGQRGFPSARRLGPEGTSGPSQ